MSQTYLPALEETRIEVNRSGVFEVRWTERNPNGKPRSRSFSCRTKDRRVAEVVRRDWLAALHAQQAQNAALSIADLVGQYEELYCAPNEVAPSQNYSLKPILKALGSYPPEGLTPQIVAKYRADRRKQGRADGTVRRELGALRTVLGWAVKNKFLPSDFDMPNIDLPPASQGKVSYLPKPEEARVFQIASQDEDGCGRLSRVGRFICIGLAAAARKEAIETLTWDRVDFEAGLIDFREVGRRVSNKRRVPVPIASRLLPVLERAHRERTSRYVLDHGGSIRTAYRTFAKTHNVGVTPHDLRRTWATLAAQRGVPMFDIAGVLGDSVETVTKHYAVYSPTGLRAAVEP